MSAVRALPMWIFPVGDGAKRTVTGICGAVSDGWLIYNTKSRRRRERDGRHGHLQALQVNLQLRISDLCGVERQVAQLAGNTRQFLQGLPANHALLWGARGTGKSSLVRALLAEYAGQGLRLIEIERDHLADLPRIVEGLAGLSQRFVLFCDDLSFETGEGDYRQLKSVLDGSLEQAPDNVLLYATSNRRHLLPERQSDNQHWQTYRQQHINSIITLQDLAPSLRYDGFNLGQ